MKSVKLLLLSIMILLSFQSKSQVNSTKTPTQQETEEFIEQTLEGYPWSDGVSINYIDYDLKNGKRVMKIHTFWYMAEVGGNEKNGMNDYYEFNSEDLQSVTFVESRVNIQVIFTFKEGKSSSHIQKELNTNETVKKFTIYLGKSAIQDNIPIRLKKAFDTYIYQVSGIKKSTAY
jgi:hypothetical protein